MDVSDTVTSHCQSSKQPRKSNSSKSITSHQEISSRIGCQSLLFAMRPTQALRALLEVERKFSPSPHSIALLRQNEGSPRFNQIQYSGAEHLDDMYYDKQNMLSGHGIYARLRHWRPPHWTINSLDQFPVTVWQAKIRRAGNYTNSAFMEVEGHEEVLAAIKERVPSFQDIAHVNELPVMAHIVSQRETWKVDNKFTVAIDSTDFGHVVGEVELEVQDLEIGSNEQAESLKLRKMDEEIAAFMSSYIWAFPVDGKVVGKLSAYFKWAGRREKERELFHSYSESGKL
jgi:thiamine-triphosphatase